MRISDVLLTEYNQEMANTRRTLERVPDGKWGWQPHAKSMTMGQLATHIMNIPDWLADTLDKDFFDFAPVGGEPYKSPTAASTRELLEKFDKSVAAGRAALAAAEDDAFMRPWSLMQGGKTLFTMPKSVVVRNFVLNHNVHHRAQLGVYLRLNDIPVPAIYGPSADEAGM
jgi:uncharacterized damage-inducible protein DinB